VDRFRLTGRLSPYDSVAIHIGAREARLCYSRPSARGRTIFGGQVVPFDTVWRTGANDPTMIHLPFAAEIAGMAVSPGKYSISTVPGRASWRVILVNRESRGGLTQGGGASSGQTAAGVRPQEVGRATVPVESLADLIEKLTIRSEARGPEEADLVLEWEKTRIRIPIRAIKGSLSPP